MGDTRRVADQLGRVIDAPVAPRRIVSLVPSLTELLFDLGLDAAIVGVTRFCVHPSRGVEAKQRVGGTKRLELDKIESLQPDLIIGNKEENDRDQVLELAESYPVWMSDVLTLDDATHMIRSVGSLVGREEPSNEMAAGIEQAFEGLQPLSEKMRVGYFIWQKPFLVAGRDTFINDMIVRCGMDNAFGTTRDRRYPEVSHEDVRGAGLDAILLSSEPYRFSGTHRREFEERFPETPVHLVDGEMFSWYGSRLLLAVDYFRRLLDTLSTDWQRHW